MLSNIKEKVINFLHDVIYILIRLILFPIDIVMHPIKNISCSFIFILYMVLYKIDIYKLSGKEMFLFSAGMVTILTFIVTFLQSVTVESSNKGNFYFGYNLKTNLHDNFWIKKLYEMNIKLFLWIIFIIPGLRIATNYSYEFKILNDISDFLKKNENNLYCIWVCFIIVVCIYCAAVLIEAINFTENKFRLSNFYTPNNEKSKYKIKQQVEKEYRNYFKSILKNIAARFKNSYNQITVNELIAYIFRKAKEVTNTQDEFNEYLECVFNAENDCIYKIYEKIDKLINSMCKIKNFKKIELFLLENYLEKVKYYYMQKWSSIKRFSYYEYSFSEICKIINIDLIRLDKLENKFINQSVDIKEIYNDLFQENYSSNELFCTNSKPVRNVCIAHIIDVLIEMCKKPQMYEDLEFDKDIYMIFNTLNRCNNLNNYISNVFVCIFNYTFKCEKRDGNFISAFCNKLQSKYCDQFIKNEAEICSYNKIMSGDNISDFQLRWLLSLLNDDDVIVAIIFCLAYAERSGKDYMSINTYRIWKDRTRELIYKNVLCKLNNDSYVDELIKKIQKSHVSHFIYPEFVKWLCKSFFVDFDSLMYQQFKDLGDKRIKNNFSLRSYMILRSLLLDEMEVYNSLSFTESENEEIQKELILVRKYI